MCNQFEVTFIFLYPCNRLCIIFTFMESFFPPMSIYLFFMFNSFLMKPGLCPVRRYSWLGLSHWHRSWNGGREDHILNMKLKSCSNFLKIINVRGTKVEEDSQETCSHQRVSAFPFPALLVSFHILQCSCLKSQFLPGWWRTDSMYMEYQSCPLWTIQSVIPVRFGYFELKMQLK